MKPLVFFVDKPEGMGSTDVVRHFKRNLPKPFKKIGHFGTLDPFATGLLIVGINGAQRLSDYLHRDYPKTYRAIGKIGVSSNTGDKTGELTDVEIPKTAYNIDVAVQESLWKERFSAGYLQSPPAYSAAKYKGKNLYEYARKGIIIEKEKVPREVIDFKIIKWELPLIEFEVTVSSGTYIRVLFEDMAKDLDTGGHLDTLRRVQIGPHSVNSAGPLEQWPANSLSVEELYPVQEIILSNPELDKKYRNGMTLNFSDCPQHIVDGDSAWVKTPQGELLGLAHRVGEQVKVLFNFPQSS
jgi:tRNA pseudouridine55 synthase